MSLTLRIFCILGSALVFLMIAKRIRKASIRIEDAVFWIVLSFFFLVIALFPEIAYACSSALGFQAPSNFVFLATITALLIKSFNNTLVISQLNNKVNELIQEDALAEVTLNSHIDSTEYVKQGNIDSAP